MADSNKLLFDEESKSLWSTVDGRPVASVRTGSLEPGAHRTVCSWEGMGSGAA